MNFESRRAVSFAVLFSSLPALGCAPDPQRPNAEDPSRQGPTTESSTQVSAGFDAATRAPFVAGADAAVLIDSEHFAEATGLLGSSHARSYMDIFCEGRSDDAAMPPDPRTLIQPGISRGKAVAFNSYFQECQSAGRPAMCGQYRASVRAGRQIVQQQLASTVLGSGFPADWYADAWRRWDGANLTERPDNFDEQARERYGLPKAPFDNPYPLPDEDPNLTHGGSGQLPVGLAQIRDADGKWSGTVGMTCELCHSSAIQALREFGRTEYLSGMGPLTADMQLLVTDLTFAIPIGMNDSRGVTNGMGMAALTLALLDQDSLGVRFDKILLMQVPGNASGCGDTKSPPWWNVSHRPRKFWDGGYSMNVTRVDGTMLNAPSAFGSPLGNDRAFNHKLRSKIDGEGVDIQVYLESLQAPVYPWPIDKELAAQGALLFHSKDLWANDANPDIPRPPTNGSCAGCHGAYAPRFANDPEFLADPQLAGMAGYIAPLEIIRTDPERLRAFTPPLIEMLSTGWISYPESSPGYVSPEDKPGEREVVDDLAIFTPGTREPGACTFQGYREGDARGYLAPPLHGIWATAPYLHNASLPDIWSVLSPDDRPAVWRRQLSRGEGREHGLDTSAAAYDTTKLGWKYDRLKCGQNGSTENQPLVDCEPTTPPNPFQELGSALQNGAASLNNLTYQVRQPESRAAVEQRKIFNSYRFAKSNKGHDFTRALDDFERHALIEYLKTL